MRYIGEFKSVSNKDYKVIIYVSDGAYQSEKEITLGTNPFVTTMDEGDKTIYKPIKYCGATINYITSNYYFNMYNQTNTNVGVTLSSGNEIIWKGYVTPNIYDMGFEYDREEISLECVDCLSILKNVNYLPNNKGIKSLKDILVYIFKQIITPNVSNNIIPWLDSFYFPENVTIENRSYPLEQIYVSEFAFMDDKKEDEQDEDCCWKCDKVLETICQLFGVTCVQWGNDIYFIDYDYIKNSSDCKYTRYTLNGTITRNISLNDSYFIDGNSYSGEGSPKLSLDMVYNKVIVKTKLRTFESILPDFFENASNITSIDTTLETSNNVREGMYGVSVESEIDSKIGINRNMICLVDQIRNDEKKKYRNKNAVFVRYFVNPDITCYEWEPLSTGGSKPIPLNLNNAMNYSQSKTYRGAILAKMMVRELDKFSAVEQAWFDWKTWTVKKKKYEFDYLMLRNEISNVSLSNYICLFNPTGNDNRRIENSSTPFNYPFLETSMPNLTSFFGGKNTYLIISGTINWHYMDDDAYPTPDKQYNPRGDKGKTNTLQYLFLPCKLQWGNKYWNGKEWTTTNTGFKLYYTEAINDSTSESWIQNTSYRAGSLVAKEFTIPNSVEWRIGTSEQGYCIPVPDNNILSGTPKFTIYRPWDPKWSNSDANGYVPKRMFIKDLKIKSIIGDPTYSKDINTDTVYTNIIDQSFVDELKDITFKLCTYDEKKPSYNTIAMYDSGSYHYIDKVMNSSLSSGEQLWMKIDNDASEYENGLRFEQHFIYRIVNQYSTPSKILDVSLHSDLKPWSKVKDQTLNDCEFVTDSIEINYKYNSQSVRLIEKK